MATIQLNNGIDPEYFFTQSKAGQQAEVAQQDLIPDGETSITFKVGGKPFRIYTAKSGVQWVRNIEATAPFSFTPEF